MALAGVASDSYPYLEHSRLRFDGSMYPPISEVRNAGLAQETIGLDLCCDQKGTELQGMLQHRMQAEQM